MKYLEQTNAIVLTALLPLTLAACTGATDQRQHHVTTNSQSPANIIPSDRDTAMSITLLGFDGCPLTPLMKERLEQAIRVVGRDLDLVQIDQQSLDSSDLRRGYPAPTVLVNESDLFGTEAPKTPSMGCRMYQGPDGVPSVSDLVDRLQEAFAQVADGEGGEG
jgi:hypothetical protein|tara:strand:+ start:1114 stop:1602 length:489 start_codon:yes stop_codon:yes gene_type:complete